MLPSMPESVSGDMALTEQQQHSVLVSSNNTNKDG